MTPLSRSRSFPRWVNAADAITVACLALVALISFSGGMRGRFLGVTLSLTTAVRPALLALLVGVIRHAVFRGEPLWQRVKRRFDGPDDPYLASHPSGRLTASELSFVTALLAALTCVMTYPQVARLDAVRDFGDPLFSLWRLAWVAHQIVRDPLHLFEANLYYPSHLTLAYSDSMVVPGILAAPFFWLGIPVVPLFNLVLLSTFVLAGLTMYLLVRSLTGQAPAALVAALAFAFYPFRFQHYYQLELLWACWMPLTLWALHRTLVSARVRDGLMAGAAFAAQMLSCVYLGLFLAAYLVPVGSALAVGAGRVRKAVMPLAAGAVLAAALLVPMLWPYTYARQVLGERSPGEVEFYSSKPQDFGVALESNMVWGKLLNDGGRAPEASFPGLVIVALALVALWPPLSVPRIAYAVGLIFAFDMSLGSHGHFFPPLYKAFVPFRGLRAPGRMSMLVGLSLSVLAGYGFSRVTAGMRRAWMRYLVVALVSVVLLAESRFTLALETVPPPSDVYQWFKGRPSGALAELPATEANEAMYTYLSTAHWQWILNGYSGAVPPIYLEFKRAMVTFPDDSSVAFLRGRSVDYLAVHEEFYGREAYRKVIQTIEGRSDLQERARAVTGNETRIYQLIK